METAEVQCISLRSLLCELQKIAEQSPESLDAEVSVELIESGSLTPLVEGVRLEKSQDLRLVNTTPLQIVLRRSAA